MTATLNPASLSHGQRKHRARRLASARRFITEPDAVPRGLLGDLSRADFVRMSTEARADLTEIIERETADHLAEIAARRAEAAPAARRAPRATAPETTSAPSTAAPSPEPPAPPTRPAAAPRPAAPRFRPGAPLEAVPVAGSVTGGRALDQQPQPRAEEPEPRTGKRGAGRDRFRPGATVVACIGCGAYMEAKPSRSTTVARCSPPTKRGARGATCGRWTPGAPVDG